LAAADHETVSAMRSQAADEAAKISDNIAAVDEKTAALNEKIRILDAQIEQCAEKERTIRDEIAATPSPTQAQPLLKQALDERLKMESLKNEVNDLQLRINMFAQQRQRMENELNIAQAKIAAADEAIRSHRETIAAAERDVEASEQEIASCQDELIAALQRAGDACEEMEEAKNKAKEYYEKALENARQACRESENASQVLAARAALAAVVAVSHVEDLALQGKIDEFMQRVAEAHSGNVPQKLTSHMQRFRYIIVEPQQAAEQAKKTFEEAAKTFEQVLPALPADVRDGYTGILKIVYDHLYELTGQEEYRTKAERLG
jgi:chromosome segregation ATPase